MDIYYGICFKWCRRPESNRHRLPHHPLKMACLPIPPRRLIKARKIILAANHLLAIQQVHREQPAHLQAFLVLQVRQLLALPFAWARSL